MYINSIIESIRANRIRITDHADEEAQVDKLSFEEIRTKLARKEVKNYKRMGLSFREA